MISYKEWSKLTEEEKKERYNELSKNDKFKARMSSAIGVDTGERVEFTEEQEKENRKELERLMKKWGVIK